MVTFLKRGPSPPSFFLSDFFFDSGLAESESVKGSSGSGSFGGSAETSAQKPALAVWEKTLRLSSTSVGCVFWTSSYVGVNRQPDG